MSFRILAAPIALALVLGGCASTGDLDISEAGAGITAVRTACPTVGVPAGTGDVTLFDPATSRDATAIDVVAAMTDVRSTCGDAGADVVTDVTFQVLARRASADGPRDVTLALFHHRGAGRQRGGRQARRPRGGAFRRRPDSRAASTARPAPASIARRRDAARRRQAPHHAEAQGAASEAAAVDPLSAPDVRAAVLRATFRGAGRLPADRRPAEV